MHFVDDLYAAMPASAFLQLVDAAPQAAGSVDPVGVYLEGTSLRLSEVANLTGPEVLPSLYEPSAAPVERTKVMVIGDSASYGVAIDLDRLDGDHLDVLWAGHENCPLVPARQVRWWAGAELDTSSCLAVQQRWPSTIQQFQPDVLVVVVSLPEHSDQRYPGDDTWYHLGDARYESVHEDAVQALMTALAPYGTRVLFANSAYSPSSPSERVDAWNAELARWAQRWPTIQVVDQAGPIAAAEAAAGHSLRPDAMHLEDAALEMIVRTVFIPAVERAGAHEEQVSP
jgi:hypothetical protein